MTISEYLEQNESRYDEACAMLRTEWKSPGYHTTIPDGRMVHPTREAVYYALALLRSGDPSCRQRVHQVLHAILPLQDTDPVSPTFGVWPWLLEEPLEEMDKPDFNWACFIGVPIAMILFDHIDELEADLAGQLKDSLLAAVYSDFRRNVRPGYTNIALMGAALQLLGGRVLDDRFALEVGTRKLERFVEHLEHHGGVSEYNSPTYTAVAVEEIEKMIHYSLDQHAVQVAMTIHEHLWQMIVTHLHPGTGEWLGPHSRAYSDRLMPRTRVWLSERLPDDVAAPFAPRTDARSGEPTKLILQSAPNLHPVQPCPESAIAWYRERYAGSARSGRPGGRTDVIQYTRLETGAPLSATVWRDDLAGLGSASEECFWTQRRGIIGYLANEAGEVSVLRVRALKDGKDFASLGFRALQSGPVVTAGLVAYTNTGDWHLMLDAPEDGEFSGSSVDLVVELSGGEWRQMSDGSLRADWGGHTVIVLSGEAVAAGRARAWSVADATGRVRLPLLEADTGVFTLDELFPLAVRVTVGVATGGGADGPEPIGVPDAGALELPDRPIGYRFS